ncbi:MAG: hypothetical protein H6722_18925 [Sandaracinus sp.]|nr:hypothetical protein [Sandaracinus sp.]MCB9614517.1 hypothetical protein [Sandaracinus sp.]MCB9620990.1 hypothetical protein [Sandaracinus sp.]MCB9622922.1 hypothetical protein [Sandaracinus sp.]
MARTRLSASHFAASRDLGRARIRPLVGLLMLVFASLPATVHGQHEYVSHHFVAEAGPRHPEPARCLDELLVALRPLVARGGTPSVQLFEAVAGLERCDLDEATREAARATAAQVRRHSIGSCADRLDAVVAPFEPALRAHCREGLCHPTHEALRDLHEGDTTLLFHELAPLIVHVVETLAARGDEWVLPAQVLWIAARWNQVRISVPPVVYQTLEWIEGRSRPGRGRFRRR